MFFFIAKNYHALLFSSRGNLDRENENGFNIII
jgi:hypothetical protein